MKIRDFRYMLEAFRGTWSVLPVKQQRFAKRHAIEDGAPQSYDMLGDWEPVPLHIAELYAELLSWAERWEAGRFATLEAIKSGAGALDGQRLRCSEYIETLRQDGPYPRTLVMVGLMLYRDSLKFSTLRSAWHVVRQRGRGIYVNPNRINQGSDAVAVGIIRCMEGGPNR